MKIARIRARNIGFSRDPATLRRHLVGPMSTFGDAGINRGSGFGPAFCTAVEVETDDGVVGVGTAGAFSGSGKSIVEQYLAELAIGHDIRRHEDLWQRMYRSTVRFGRRGAVMTAISAVDIACWDGHGIAEGKPVVELLGGWAQETMPAYASRCYALDDLDALADEAAGYVGQGFTRIKQRFGFGPGDGLHGMRRNVDLVRTVRHAVGPDVELSADAYMGWDFGYAMTMAERLREFGLSWIEEPLMPHDTERYAELRERVPWQRWSCGEHSYTKWDFHELIGRRASDILQPDVSRVGGLTEARKICALAETAGLPVIPHSNEAHNLHLAFSQPASVCPMIEYFPDVEPDTGNELFWKLFDGNAVAAAGALTLPAGRPGLGVTLNEQLVGELLAEDGKWITSA